MSSQFTDTGLSPGDRKTLKALAHSLNPVVMIGDKGLTASVLKEIDVNLSAHQLIKIRVAGDDRQFRIDLLAEITEATGALPVQHIGKLLVIYRADTDKPLLAPPAKKSSRKTPTGDKPRSTERTGARGTGRGSERTSERTSDRPGSRGAARTSSGGRSDSRTGSRSTGADRGEFSPRQRREADGRSDNRYENGRPPRPTTHGSKTGESRRAPARRSAAAETGSASSPTRARPASAPRTAPSRSRAGDRTAPSQPTARRPKRPA